MRHVKAKGGAHDHSGSLRPAWFCGWPCPWLTQSCCGTCFGRSAAILLWVWIRKDMARNAKSGYKFIPVGKQALLYVNSQHWNRMKIDWTWLNHVWGQCRVEPPQNGPALRQGLATSLVYVDERNFKRFVYHTTTTSQLTTTKKASKQPSKRTTIAVVVVVSVIDLRCFTPINCRWFTCSC